MILNSSEEEEKDSLDQKTSFKYLCCLRFRSINAIKINKLNQ